MAKNLERLLVQDCMFNGEMKKRQDRTGDVGTANFYNQVEYGIINNQQGKAASLDPICSIQNAAIELNGSIIISGKYMCKEGC